MKEVTEEEQMYQKRTTGNKKVHKGTQLKTITSQKRN